MVKDIDVRSAVHKRVKQKWFTWNRRFRFQTRKSFNFSSRTRIQVAFNCTRGAFKFPFWNNIDTGYLSYIQKMGILILYTNNYILLGSGPRILHV